MPSKETWTILDFSCAMEQSVRERANPKFIKLINDKLLFNGFWRNGDKSNACIWLKKATWSDAKTGQGGGCKEFAKVVFNMTLSEFMAQYGEKSPSPSLMIVQKSRLKSFIDKPVDEIWLQLNEKNKNHSDRVLSWLEKSRGFDSPEQFIDSGFIELKEEDITTFGSQFQGFIKNRLALGPQIVVPLRSKYSSKVVNLFFRAIQNVGKDQKSRLLPDAGGWTDNDDSPRAFGFPHLVNDFPRLILCEGMADYFAVKCLIRNDENYVVIGAANASALTSWATHLAEIKYRGKVIILYQLDTDHSGKVSSQAIGQTKAAQALKIMLENRISASFFQWPKFLRLIKDYNFLPGDIADVCQIISTKFLSEPFMATVKEAG